MPAAIPALAAAAAGYGATAWAVSTGFVLAGSFGAAIVGGVASLAASTALGSMFAPEPDAPDLSAALNSAGAGRTQQFRQPVAPRQVCFGRGKQSGPIMYIHSMPDDEGRADGYFYIQHALAGHHVKAIGDIYFGDELASDAKFVGYARVGKNLGTASQIEDADFLAEIGADFEDHWLRGVANIATRLKIKIEPFPSGAPNIAAIFDGNDEIYDPR